MQAKTKPTAGNDQSAEKQTESVCIMIEKSKEFPADLEIMLQTNKEKLYFCFCSCILLTFILLLTFIPSPDFFSFILFQLSN